MQDPIRARQAVQAALWQRGLRSIDAVVISHADIDHFNGVPGLAQTMPIGSVLVHETFLDFKQPGVETTCDLLAQRGVPIKLIQAGDQLSLDPAVRLAVLHPPSSDRLPTDNANSLVLAIEFGGRRIVLTGDLERDGLEYVLMQSPRHADVMQAPHHGRVNANPRRLAEWATPDWVIVSDGRQDSSDKLPAVYGPATRILSTQKSGAITFVIDRTGKIECQPFRETPGEPGK
jgi:competence protein ComEC